MAFKLATVAADALLNTLASMLNGGFLRIYSGTEPANANIALAAGNVLLAELTLGNPAFSATITTSGNDRVLTANVIGADPGADADGTAVFFRAVNGSGTVIYQGTVSTTGQQLTLDFTNLVQNGPVQVQSLTIALPLS